MQTEVFDIKQKKLADITLKDDVFGVPYRSDIIARVVDWQLAKRRAGTHSTRGISELSGTTKKPYKQKGTGRARQGSLRSPQFRGGAVIFGPVVRSHETLLPKKVRKLGLKVALSQKLREDKLKVFDFSSAKELKTKDFASFMAKLGVKSALVVDGSDSIVKVRRATSNLINVDALPEIGANVYDIVKHDVVILTPSAITSLEARL